MNRYRDQADVLRLMAHPVRLQILDTLRRDAECVCHLSALMSKPQPYISQQLALLRNAGLIEDEKEGSNVFYRLVDAHVAGLVANTLGSGPEGGTDRRALAHCICPKCRKAKGDL